MYASSALPEQPSGAAGVGQVPGRGDWMAAWLLLVLCVAAAVMSAAALARAQEPPRPAPPAAPPAAPAYTPGEVAAAIAKTCAAWWTASEAMNNAANAINDVQPPGWDNPARQQARDHEADLSLAQTAYLKNQVGPATPAELRRLLDQYNALTFAQLDASAHRLGDQVDALIGQQNAVLRDIDAMCQK